jgi:hypothetical protein
MGGMDMSWSKAMPLSAYLYDLMRSGKTKTPEWSFWLRTFGIQKVEALIEREKKERYERSLRSSSHASRTHKDD